MFIFWGFHKFFFFFSMAWFTNLFSCYSHCTGLHTSNVFCGSELQISICVTTLNHYSCCTVKWLLAIFLLASGFCENYFMALRIFIYLIFYFYTQTLWLVHCSLMARHLLEYEVLPFYYFICHFFFSKGNPTTLLFPHTFLHNVLYIVKS